MLEPPKDQNVKAEIKAEEKVEEPDGLDDIFEDPEAKFRERWTAPASSRSALDYHPQNSYLKHQMEDALEYERRDGS